MSTALQLIDQFIHEVKNAKTVAPTAAAAASAAAAAPQKIAQSAAVSSCSSVCSASSSSSSAVFGGVIGDDIAWFPITPVGHTVYSWVGEDGEHINDPFLSPFPPGSPFQTVAPGASSKGASIASSNTTPAPVSAPASTTSTPAQSGKEEKKENNKKNDNKKAEKKEEKPAAGKNEGKKDAKKDDKKKVDAAAVAALAEEEKAQSGTPLIARMDIRVGKIVSIKNHPKADRLYIEEIDVGEEKPRQILSGLRQNIPIEELQGADLLVICNFLPAKMQGELSNGMVLAASNDDKTVVELVKPPAGAKPGERVTIDGVDVKSYRPDKDFDGRAEGSVWQRFAQTLLTNGDGVATFDGKALKVSTGECKVKSLKNVKIA